MKRNTHPKVGSTSPRAPASPPPKPVIQRTLSLKAIGDSVKALVAGPEEKPPEKDVPVIPERESEKPFPFVKLHVVTEDKVRNPMPVALTCRGRCLHLFRVLSCTLWATPLGRRLCSLASLFTYRLSPLSRMPAPIGVQRLHLRLSPACVFTLWTSLGRSGHLSLLVRRARRSPRKKEPLRLVQEPYHWHVLSLIYPSDYIFIRTSSCALRRGTRLMQHRFSRLLAKQERKAHRVD